MFFIISSVQLHSTPFVQPWKGRSGTGLARVRGGRTGPTVPTRYSFICLCQYLKCSYDLLRCYRVPYQRAVSEISPTTPKGSSKTNDINGVFKVDKLHGTL